jgi:Protein of unknown function (DUF732)
MFAKRRVTMFAATAVATAALGLTALAAAGTAGAFSSPDDEFLSNISDDGISYDSASRAVSNAHYVCGSIDDGADPLDLGDEILANTDLTMHQAAVFVVESVSNYCPEHTAALP